MAMSKIYIFFIIIIFGYGCKNQNETSSTVKPRVSEEISSQLETRILGRLYTSKKYQGDRLTVFNLNEAEWPFDQEHPQCPGLAHLRSNQAIDVNSEVLPFNLRIPYPVSYANLEHFNLLSLIRLNNQIVFSLIPAGVIHELAARSIKFGDVPVFIALYEADFKSEVFNYYTHFWAHDAINIKVNKTIDIATGFFNPVGVNTDGVSEAVGINELKTHGAYVHPVATRAGLSPNNAKFRLDSSRDAVTFWALSVDVDPKSAYLNSAILIWHIAIIHQPPHPRGEMTGMKPKDRQYRFKRMLQETARKIKDHDLSPCIENFNIKDWLEEFAALSYINPQQHQIILEQLKQLMAAPR